MIGDTPLRRALLIRGVGALIAAAVAAFCWLFWAPFLGSAPFTISLIVVAVGVGAHQIWLARRTPPTAVIRSYVDPSTLPPAERRSYMRRQLIGAAVVFPLISLWIWKSLSDLEAHATETVRVWAPIGLIYEHLGYWPAVLATPVLGFTICVFWFHRLINMESHL
jgi:predicted lysophospholipase L1 biosynthesis ABC-type transport system permease subunit